MPKAEAERNPGPAKRALVVGISNYPNRKDRLPAVAVDVREMAPVLSSRHGVFPESCVTVLTDGFCRCRPF